MTTLPDRVARSLAAAARAFTEHPSVQAWNVDGEAGLARFAAIRFINQVPWLVEGEISAHPRTGLARVRSLRVAPWRHEREVTRTVLKNVKVGAIRDEAAQKLRAVGAPLTNARTASARPAPDREPRPRGRGRPPLPSLVYFDVAMKYLELYELCGVTTGIHARLAEELGISRAQAVRYVNRAREIGYLSPGQQGRPGARPGRRMFDEAGGAVAISDLP